MLAAVRDQQIFRLVAFGFSVRPLPKPLPHDSHSQRAE